MTRIRPATESDLPVLLEIYNDIILHTTAVYSYEPHTLEMRQAWYKDKLDHGYPVLVAEDDGRVIGFTTFGPFRAWPAYQYTVEHSVYVAADQRGKGLGKALLTPIIEAARSKGMHALIAGIDSTNDASIKLHKSFGFEQVAHFKEVGYKFDRWLDLVFMELILT
jgi:phosphinothricin acetyltransferase